jgi:hypothetical protein
MLSLPLSLTLIFLFFHSFYCIYFPSFLSFFLLSKCLSLLFFPPLFFLQLLASPFPFLPLSFPSFYLLLSVYIFSFFLCRSSSSISVTGAAAYTSTICKIRARPSVCDNYQSQHLYYQNTLVKTADRSIPWAGLEHAPHCLSGSRKVIYSAEQNMFPRFHCPLIVFTHQKTTHWLFPESSLQSVQCSLKTVLIQWNGKLLLKIEWEGQKTQKPRQWYLSRHCYSNVTRQNTKQKRKRSSVIWYFLN